MPETLTRSYCDRLWSQQTRTFDHGEAAADYWDRRSQTFHCACQESNYAEELIKRMDLRPVDSVLDVGSGCGAVAIPLARRGIDVTALDISQIRLEKLSRKAAAEELDNINILNLDWDRVTVGVEVQPHDIVLLSRNICTRLSETLKKVSLAAKNAFYITWRAERTDPFEVELAAALGKDHLFFPDYSIMSAALCQMGINVTTEIFEDISREQFDSPRAAALSFSRGAPIEERQYTRLLEIAGKYLKENDSGYSLVRKTRWALISWKKSSLNSGFR